MDASRGFRFSTTLPLNIDPSSKPRPYCELLLARASGAFCCPMLPPEPTQLGYKPVPSRDYEPITSHVYSQAGEFYNENRGRNHNKQLSNQWKV